jgi:hypothetical protein
MPPVRSRDANFRPAAALARISTIPPTITQTPVNTPTPRPFAKVTLKIKKQGLVGANPFSTHGNIQVDIREGAFSNSSTLQLNDFQASSSSKDIGTIKNTALGSWHSANLLDRAFPYIYKVGSSQFRLRFMLDDNNAVVNHISF